MARALHSYMPMILFSLIVLALAACSHDSKRANPLDPERTPPVEVEARLDEATGAVALTWRPFNGDEPLSYYRLERRVQGQLAWSAKDSLTTATDTTWTDSTLVPETDYEYRVTVVNVAGFERPSVPRSVSGYTILPVRLLRAQAVANTQTIELTWERYTDPGFAGYVVTRRQVGTDDLVQLAHYPSVMDTGFVDATARHRVSYVYRVVTLTTTDSLSSNEVESTLTLNSVAQLPLVLDAATATATVRWAPYTGPRFHLYRVWRSVEALAPVPIAELSTSTVATFVDTGLAAGIPHTYRVDVVTTAGEVIAGGERSGQLHATVAEWFLDVESEDRARLYASGDTLELVTATDSSTTLQRMTSEGLPMAEAICFPAVDQDPKTVSLARGDDDTVFLTSQSHDREQTVIRGAARIYAVHADTAIYTPGARVVLQEAPSTFQRLLVEGVTLQVNKDGFVEYLWAPFPFATMIRQGGQVVFQETRDERLDGWTDVVRYDELRSTTRYGLTAESGGWAADEVQIDFGMRHGLLATTHGSRTSSRMNIRLIESIEDPNRARLLVVVTEDGISMLLFSAEKDTSHAWPINLRPGVPHRLRATVANGDLEVSLSSLAAWRSATNYDDFVGGPGLGGLFHEARPRASLASVGNALVLARADTLLLFDRADGPDADVSSQPRVFEANDDVGDLLFWERVRSEGSGSHRLGMVFPEVSSVHVANTRVRLGRPSFAIDSPEVTIGTQPGSGPGEFIFPLEMAVGPDERIYVLDAGNYRVQVFDHDGSYITQFGRRGSGPGEFDFLGGSTPDDFAGSIAVDQDGFIYVADVGNRRVQKFAP